ncbi:MFS transporter [Corynebacterium afermentans]|uniref:MFS transporter n=1 Tax=Corynebacterium afermentans TaxID=38286 RepID=UPI0025B513A3|nr:MFS transporter [Corynebacterium afermentans]WJY59631.1 Antiseptic resistance protein [Corynebacterium afermentans subsp. lipophilum]
MSTKHPHTPVDAGQESTDEFPGRWKALGVLAAGLALIVMDGTIVGVSLPTMISALDLSLTNAQWVNAIYNVIFAALLLGSGRLGDRVGRKTTFVAGVILFVAGSLLAATATGATSLISARAVQGVGGALVLPATLSSVNSMFHGKDRAAAFGIWGAVMSGTAALGPLLGGVLTQYASWQWIFWVNLPLGILVLIGIFAWVPQTHGKQNMRGVDVDGLLTSAIGFGLIVFGLIEATTLGWWDKKETLRIGSWSWPESWSISPVPFAIGIGVIFIALFVRWELHRAHNGRDALLDLSLFKVDTFSWGNLTAATVAIGEFSLMFVLPLFLINSIGLSTVMTGLVLAAMALGAFASGASARHLAARLGAPGVVVLGLALEVVGVALLTGIVAVQASTWFVVGALVIYGVGLGLASAQLTSTVLGDIPEELSGAGSATQSTVRQLGSAFGAAIAGSALGAAMARKIPDALSPIDGVPQPALDGLSEATQASAGSVIGQLRDAGPDDQMVTALGDARGAVVDQLSAGFAESAAWSIGFSALFLVLGLLGSFMVALQAKRQAW